MANFKDKYFSTIRKSLAEGNKLASVEEAPRLQKIVLNMGVGEAVNSKDALKNAVNDMRLITGQHPVITKVRKSEAGFKIREDWPIGCKVTLRREKMYSFLERMINIYIPRIRDFRGYSAKAFDGTGNYSFGIREQSTCPEIDYDAIDAVRGFDVSIITTTNSDKLAMELLKAFGFPFR